MRLFNSLALTHARYITGQININGANVSLAGNHVEGVPDWIERSGLQFLYGGFSSTIQYSYVSKGFSDANNTVFNSTGIVGVVPAYHVFDFPADWHFLKYYHVSAGVNNIANAKYFTRRINMYPGPGILPADGRSFYIGLDVKF
ncbi:MAG: TonB-dependent receptor [Bacteroidetes bacterium]|nr:TonB-dependent receptor [Bacteroidota bacterium]